MAAVHPTEPLGCGRAMTGMGPFLILIDALFSSCLPRSSQMPAMRIERDDLHLRQPGRRAQFVADSLLEETGFEPSVPRDTDQAFNVASGWFPANRKVGAKENRHTKRR